MAESWVISYSPPLWERSIGLEGHLEVVTATLSNVVMAVMLPRLLSMAVSTCNLGIKKQRQEDLIFEASGHCGMVWKTWARFSVPSSLHRCPKP